MMIDTRSVRSRRVAGSLPPTLPMPLPLILPLYLLLAGCAALPPAQLEGEVAALARPQVAAGIAWRRSADDERRVAGQVDALARGGLTVEHAVAIALLANPDLQQRFESLGIARASYLAAIRPPNPFVSASARAVRGGPGEDLQWGVLEDLLGLLSLPARSAAARAELDGARLETADAVVRIAAETRIAAWQDVGAQRARALLDERAEVAELLLELAERFRSAGNLTRLDAERERDAALAARMAAGEGELEAERTRARLVRLLGDAPLAAGFQISDALPALPAADPPLEQLLSQAPDRRLDLLAARRLVAARLGRLRLARATRLVPRLEAGVSSEAFPGGARVEGPALALEVPLFTAGEVALAAGDSEARGALRRSESLALDVSRDLHLAHAAMTEARRRHASWNDALIPLRSAIVEEEQGRAAYLLADTAEPLRGRQRLIEAELAATRSLTDYWSARIELARAAGDLDRLGGLLP